MDLRQKLLTTSLIAILILMTATSYKISQQPMFQSEEPLKRPPIYKAGPKLKGPVIKVAVIDTGFDHRSTWPTAPMPTATLCSDGSYNFVDNNEDADDPHGHGTHIAGLIAKYAKDANFCIVALRYYDSKGSDVKNLTNSVLSFRRAVELKVDFINYSGGGIARSDEECTVVKDALDAGIVVVAAAGNERSDIDDRPYWPAMCDPRIVIVGNTDKEGEPAESTNYSRWPEPDTTNIEYELGVDVLSTLTHNQFGFMTGTSQSTATMTGKLVNALAKIRSDKYLNLVNKRAK